MLEQELKDIWKKSSQAEQIRFDVSHLIKDFKMNLKLVEKRVISRDRREIIVAFLTMVAFTYLAFEVPFWLTKIASILVVASMGFIIYKLWSNRKKEEPQDLTVSYKDQLENQLSFMNRQSRLLDSVLYWYIIPPFAAQLMFIWSLGDRANHDWPTFLANILPFELASKILFTVVVILMGGFLVWLNKRAIKLNWDPLIEQVHRIQNQMSSVE